MLSKHDAPQTKRDKIPCGYNRLIISRIGAKNSVNAREQAAVASSLARRAFFSAPKREHLFSLGAHHPGPPLPSRSDGEDSKKAYAFGVYYVCQDRR